MKQNINRGLLISIVGSVVFAAVIVCLVLVFLKPIQGNADTAVNYSVNDSGFTYGSALDAPSPELEPDLISAWATNETLGYVYKADLEKAQMPYEPKNPEEAVQLMEDRFMAASFIFVESAHEQTGPELSIGVDTVNETLRTIFETYGGEPPFDRLTDEERSAIVQLIPNSDNAVEIASNAYTAACQANDKSIPVYEADGTTIIGEFIVS
jgi:hypothetical protein